MTAKHRSPDYCKLCFLHAGLEQWEQEVKLYVALKQLRLFRQHKLWKAFKCWKSAIDSTKLTGAKAMLNKQLFLLSPVFQQPLQQFHALCHQLSSMRLHSIKPGQVSSSCRRDHDWASIEAAWPSPAKARLTAAAWVL